jgi:hypothetical protein
MPCSGSVQELITSNPPGENLYGAVGGGVLRSDREFVLLSFRIRGFGLVQLDLTNLGCRDVEVIRDAHL